MFHLLPAKVHTTSEFYSLKDKKPDKYIEANRFFCDICPSINAVKFLII